MIRTDSTFRQLFFLMFCLGLLLQGCASGKGSLSGIKTGMHIDAVLECAIEYPLLWTKDRRLAYGSKNGEIRWTPPKHDGTILRLISQQRGQETIDPEQQIEHFLQEFVDLEISLNEMELLPAGEATHIIGATGKMHIEIYQLTHDNRSYLISFTMLKENVKTYARVMKKVISSFQVLQ
jgi:hypothetical protein